jgi:hypothetical protein
MLEELVRLVAKELRGVLLLRDGAHRQQAVPVDDVRCVRRHRQRRELVRDDELRALDDVAIGLEPILDVRLRARAPRSVAQEPFDARRKMRLVEPLGHDHLSAERLREIERDVVARAPRGSRVIENVLTARIAVAHLRHA